MVFLFVLWWQNLPRVTLWRATVTEAGRDLIWFILQTRSLEHREVKLLLQGLIESHWEACVTILILWLSLEDVEISSSERMGWAQVLYWHGTGTRHRERCSTRFTYVHFMFLPFCLGLSDDKHVRMGTHVHGCACVHRFMYLWCPAHFSLPYCFVYCNSLICIDWLASKRLGSSHLWPLELVCKPSCLGFYVGVGAPNLGFHACKAGACTVREESYLQPPASAFILFLFRLRVSLAFCFIASTSTSNGDWAKSSHRNSMLSQWARTPVPSSTWS